MSGRRHLATAGIFLLLAVAHTWPLAARPGTWSRVDHGDYALNAWILAWVVHQAPRDPLHLFDANIFHPEPRTLAFSEHLVPQAVLAAPVLWAGGSAVLAYNVVLILGFALTGWAMAFVITRWTGDWPSGLLAGSLLAFNAHALTRLAHVQGLHNYYLPLALLAFDRLLLGGGTRAALAFGAATALHGLTSGYALVFAVVASIGASAARVREWWPWVRPPGASAVIGFARVREAVLAACVAGVILAPFLWPYWLAKREQGLTRPVEEVTRYSATWVEYVTSASRLHMASPLRWGYEEGGAIDTLFPGITGTLLALAAVFTGVAWRDRRARMCLVIGALGVFLSLGPRTPIYAWMYEHVPLLQGIRAATRYGFLLLFAVAALAGFSLAAWRARRAERRASAAWTLALTILAVFVVNAEALRAPFVFREYRGESRVYDVIAQLPGDVVLAEFPMYKPADFYKNAGYMLSSTRHWKPMVNGYSGFLPARYRELADGMRSFPEPAALDRLRAAGVTHVVYHRNLFGEGRDILLATMRETGAFQPVASDEQVELFRLLPR